MSDFSFEAISAFFGDTAGTAGEATPFVSDIGTTIAEGWTSLKSGANGIVNSARTVAQNGIASGSALLTMDVGVAGAVAAPLLGVAAGVGLYNVAPDFWDGVADHLIAAGETIDGKVTAFLDENGYVNFSEGTINAFYNAFNDAGVYDASYTSWNGVAYDGLSVTAPIIGGGAVIALKNSTTSIQGVVRTSESTYAGFSIPDNTIPISGCLYDSAGVLSGIFCASDSPFHNAFYTAYEDGTIRGYGAEGEGQAFTFNNQTVYYRETPFTDGTGLCANGAGNSAAASAWYLIFGAATSVVTPYLDDNAILPTAYPTISDFMDALGVGGVSLPTDTDAVGYPLNPVADGGLAGTQEGVISLPQDIPWEKLLDWLLNPTAEDTSEGALDLTDAIDGTIPAELPTDIPDNPAIPDSIPIDPPIEPDPYFPTPTPILPIIPPSSSSGKLFEVYSVTANDLNTLGGYLWSTDILETLQKIWSNPLEACIALFRVWASPSTGTSRQVYLGNTAITGLSCPVVSSQFKRFDLGSVSLLEVNKNVGDYSPYTQVSIYLPFIGIFELDTDEVMNGTLNVQYVVDFWTGTCIAELRLTKAGSTDGTLLYVYNGNMAQQIPLTSSTFNGIFSSLLAAGGAAASVASGGALAPAMAMGLGGLLTHDMVHVQRSGLISSNAGIMTQKTPQLIIARRHIANATEYNSLTGFPANKTKVLGNISGFARVKAINLKVSATEPEKEEIESLLKDGVIF